MLSYVNPIKCECVSPETDFDRLKDIEIENWTIAK
jgi:hypothetical protein